MRSFDQIRAIAVERHGEEGVAARLLSPKPPGELAAIPDDRWLSTFSKAVFQAGFSWKVVETKWPGFEEAFDGFDPGRCAMIDDDRIEALLKDTRIVRNGAKIASVRDNAILFLQLAAFWRC